MEQVVKNFKIMDKELQIRFFKEAMSKKDAPLVQALVKAGFRWTIKINGKKYHLHSKKLDFWGLDLCKIPYEINYFPYLEELNMASCRIKKIEELKNLNSLQRLYLDDNQIEKIEGLENLRELRELSLFKNGISKIEGLGNLNQLRVLSLGKNQIKKLEGLERLKNLCRLHLEGNQIEKIENLEMLNELQVLSLGAFNLLMLLKLQMQGSFSLGREGNLISKIEGLEKLKNLKYLTLGSNRIRKLEGLEQLKNLEYLSLSRNRIKEISRKDKIAKSLQVIELEGNPIQLIHSTHFNLILKEINAESRNQLMNLVGIEEIMRHFGTILIDKQNNYQLVDFNIEVNDRWGKSIQTYRPYLKMKNPSTGEWHIEGVHPDCRTVNEALAWRDGEEVYKEPEVLT